MVELTQPRRSVLIGACLALATAAVYWPVRHFDFTNYDDGDYVYENPQVQNGLTLRGLVWAFTTNHSSNWHPLTWLSHMLDWQLWGSNAGAHHLVNVLLHVANALLLFTVLQRMTAAPWRSGFVAAVFALHPLHVQSVAWVAERKDVLSTFFWMLTMWAYVRYVEQPDCKRYWLTVGLYALGLMAKPMVVTLPFVLLLLDCWPLGRTRWAKSVISESAVSPLSRLVREKVPFLVLAAASCVATVWAQRSGETIAPFEAVALGSRMANAIVSYVRYMEKVFWPVGLAAFYPYELWPLSTVMLAGAVLFGVSGVVAWRATREPYLALGWLWYVGTLVPVIGLAQVGIQSMADRYTYVPLIGFMIMVAWGVPHAVGEKRRPKLIMATAAVVLLAACVVISQLQVRYWKNTETLFRHALEVTTNNWLAHSNLAIALFEQGKTSEAMEHFEEAVRIMPDSADVHRNLGNAQLQVGEVQKAVAHYREALRLKPDYAEAHNNLGFALFQQGRATEAEEQFERALRIKPEYAKAHYNLGNVLAQSGRALDAIRHYQEALRITPEYAEAHRNLGLALEQTGRVGEAIEHLRAANRLLPTAPDTCIQLAKALGQEGRFAEAITTLQSALSTNNPNPAIANEYSWLLVTCPVAELRDGPQAIQIAEELVKATGRRAAPPLDTLAAAYADTGRFDEAVAVAIEASAVAEKNKQMELATAIRSRLALYEKHQPYRLAPP